MIRAKGFNVQVSVSGYGLLRVGKRKIIEV